MILKVDESYKKEASQLYQLVAAATNGRDDDWKVVSPLSIFAVALAEEKDSNLILTAKRPFLDHSKIKPRCHQMASRLTSRSGVKDRLEKWETQSILKDWTGGSSADVYNPTLAILKSSILQLKSIRDTRHDLLNSGECIDSVILFARRVQRDTGSGQAELMDEFFNVASRWIRGYSSTEIVFRPDSSPSTIAVQCGLHRYLWAKLENDNVLKSWEKTSRSFLDYALLPGFGLVQFVSVDIVSVLLDFGADSRKPWLNAINYLERYLGGEIHSLSFGEDRNFVLARWEEVIKRLLDAGVDLTPHADSVLRAMFPPNQYIELWEKAASLTRAKSRRSRTSRILDKDKWRQQ
ncbi:hypothetical protein HYALB_00006575 [Hymenoscyphus albidus]|uniref:Uncharacterized protein n=1 Tax=Hymenoscyphus albidus TaxID=595503 RepID=A0A9N9LXT6_9HELO|nr:hypothetical protein HYALB_00006575 [Hymenoscyphus albidus]